MDYAPPTALLAAALDYAGRGLRVVPLHQVLPGSGSCSCGSDACTTSAGKHPRVKDWSAAASVSEDQVREWWGKWQRANVGVALGSASGVVAIDIDPPAGEAHLAQLAGDDLPPTWEMLTGKKGDVRGRRLLYAIPDGVSVDPKTVALKDADGNESVRLQSTGGQCVMPPSMHPSGVRYQWTEARSPAEAAIAPMPLWLIRLMEPLPAVPTWSNPGAADTFGKPGGAYNRGGMAAWMELLSSEGAKHAGDVGEKRYVTRPGKRGGVSGTIGYYHAKDGTPALYVFSGSWPKLAAGKCYDLFGAYAAIRHGGDFAAAARALGAAGFGEQRPARSTRPVAPAPVPSTNGTAPAAPAAPTVPARPAEWPVPIPLDRPADPLPEFPGVLPPSLAGFVCSVAEATNTPVDYAATYLIGTAAGLIGATLAVDVGEDWSEKCVLYTCVVAPKSSGKTPAFLAITKPMNAQAAEWKQKGDKRIAVAKNFTVESLVPPLEANPRGLLVAVDELSAWVASFNQYKAKGSGSDRQFWLSNWSGEPLDVLRKNPEAPHIHIPYPCVSVVGGVQPVVVDDIRGGRDDGFMERVLFAYPDPLPPTRYKRKGHVGKDEWRAVAGSLLAREMVQGDHGRRPYWVKLDRDAEAVFDQWTGDQADALRNPDRDTSMDGVRVKLNGVAARLALVCHALRTAAASRNVDSHMPAEDMEAGVKLARYFLAHGQRVHGLATANPGVEDAKRVLGWLGKWADPVVTGRDVHRGLQRRFASIEAIRPALRTLVAHGFLRYADEPTTRRDSTRYEVHPSVNSVNGVSARALTLQTATAQGV